MSVVTNPPELSQQAIELFRTNSLRIRAPISAERLWTRHMTPQDRERLGGDLQKAYKLGTAGMWIKLRGVSLPRAIADVALKLGFLREDDYHWLLREAGEIVEGEDALEDAIASRAFVLVERPREAYWDGERIELDWQNLSALWEFVWEMCRAAKAGQPIDSLTFGDGSKSNVVTQRKYRLSKLEGFPFELFAAIDTVGRGSQQLMIPPEQIRIFHVDGVDGIREWNP